jgi:hypothetical protein
VYQAAPRLLEEGTYVISSDEKTGIQALERKHPTLPMKPGRVERREFEYVRHGTLCLMAHLEVATGQMRSPSITATRTEAEWAAHYERLLASDPQAGFILVSDRLNTHVSETMVRLVAKQCGIDTPLGEKGKCGILRSRQTREAFLTDPSHRVRCVFTPKHCSWLNTQALALCQVECWFSILVRRLLKRGSFTSVQELETRLRQFIDYFNRTLAKPFAWTYGGKPLQF